MTLTPILLFTAIALLYGALFKGRGRDWLILAASVLAVYWLQPSTPIRNLDFWLPTASLALTIIVWAATRSHNSQIPGTARQTAAKSQNTNLQSLISNLQPPTPNPQSLISNLQASNLLTFLVVAGLVLLVALNRYLDFCCLTASRPPDLGRVLIALALVAALTFGISRLSGNYKLLIVFLTAFIALFVVLKADPLAQQASAGLRTLSGQSVGQAAALDIRWLGFSYLAFRLIHVLRERMNGTLRVADLSLREFLCYAVFFPALSAGPIDRVERFVKDLRAPFELSAAEVMNGGWRIFFGVFKKFAVADTLALIALNGFNAGQTTSTFWLWILVYAYTLRIYFDFSGYTDIAVGLGRLLGVKLPENFDRPYLRQNLTAFWNNWHITLTQWFRTYYFNPLTRALRSRGVSLTLIIFLTQLSTMILVGLWHGITWNFVVWGAWHGLGLFAHNRWVDFMKPRAAALATLESRPWPPTDSIGGWLKRAAGWGGVAFTFHYVALGWVWFALPEIGLAGRTILKLFGIS